MDNAGIARCAKSDRLATYCGQAAKSMLCSERAPSASPQRVTCILNLTFTTLKPSVCHIRKKFLDRLESC